MPKPIAAAEHSLWLSLDTIAKRIDTSDQPRGQRFYAWVAAELERLAGEAYNLADEIGDDTGANPSLDGPLPGFDT